MPPLSKDLLLMALDRKSQIILEKDPTKVNRNPIIRAQMATKFVKWCDQRGITRRSVDLTFDESSQFSIEAERNLAPGNVILKVPKKSLLSTDMLREEIYELLVNAGIDTDLYPYLPMALTLIQERLEPSWSKFKPYFDVLPAEPDHVVFLTKEHLDMLKNSQSYELARDLWMDTLGHYCKLIHLIARDAETYSALGLTERSFTLRLYRWAVATALMRSVPTAGPATRMMVPFWDLANPDNWPTAKLQFARDDTLQAFATKDIPAGGEILAANEYVGMVDKSFVFKGIVPYRFSVPGHLGSLSRAKRLIKEKMDVLWKAGYPFDDDIRLNIYDGMCIVEEDAFWKMILLCSPPVDLYAALSTNDAWICAWDLIYQSIKARIFGVAGYEHKPEQYDVLLESATMWNDTPARFVLRQLRGEVNLLENAMIYAKLFERNFGKACLRY